MATVKETTQRFFDVCMEYRKSAWLVCEYDVEIVLLHLFRFRTIFGFYSIDYLRITFGSLI